MSTGTKIMLSDLAGHSVKNQIVGEFGTDIHKSIETELFITTGKVLYNVRQHNKLVDVRENIIDAIKLYNSI